MKLIPKSTRSPLRYSIKDGAYYSFMVGIGETYLAAYVLALGFGQIFSGLVTVIPMLAGSIAQLLTAFYKKNILSHKKKWVVFCSAVQGISLLFIAVGAFLEHRSALIIFALTSIYWAAGLSAGPTWNAWIGQIIPPRVRISFFSFRSQICHLFLLIGLVFGGGILHLATSDHILLKTFSAMFIIAGISRLVSSFYLYLHPEKALPNSNLKKNDPPNTLFKIKDNQILKLLLYLFIVQIGVYISSPYLNPFMLKKLNLEYSSYMILISSALISRIFSYKYLGLIAKRRGAHVLLALSAIGIPLLPAMWIVSDNLYYLIFSQLIAGIFWGAYELGTFFILLNKYNEDVRSDILTMVNFLNSLGMLIGSCIGGYILSHGNLSLNAYYNMFIASTLIRSLPLLLLPQLMQIRVPARKISKMIFTKVFALRPAFGISRPLLFENRKKKTKSLPINK